MDAASKLLKSACMHFLSALSGFVKGSALLSSAGSSIEFLHGLLTYGTGVAYVLASLLLDRDLLMRLLIGSRWLFTRFSATYSQFNGSAPADVLSMF